MGRRNSSDPFASHVDSQQIRHTGAAAASDEEEATACILSRSRSSGAARAWPRGIAGARARDASRAPTLLRGTSSSQSPGSTIVPPRDRAWTRLARRFVRRRESFCAFQRGALAKPRAVWGRGWISQSAAIEKNEGLGTPQKMSVCTNV